MHFYKNIYFCINGNIRKYIHDIDCWVNGSINLKNGLTLYDVQINKNEYKVILSVEPIYLTLKPNVFLEEYKNKLDEITKIQKKLYNDNKLSFIIDNIFIDEC